MNFVRMPKISLRPAMLVVAGLFAATVALSAADAPTDSAPPPAPAPAPPANGSWFVFSPPKDGVVLTPPMREKLFAAIKNFLDRSNAEQLAHLKNSPNPFFPKLPPQATTPATNNSSSAPAPAPPSQLSFAEKLQQVADQLKPSGALIGGQSRLIIFANGDTLSVGQAIHVTFPGDSAPTEILLQGVSSDNFTLKLGDTAKTFPYVAKDAVSHSNSTTTTPEPKSRQ